MFAIVIAEPSPPLLETLRNLELNILKSSILQRKFFFPSSLNYIVSLPSKSMPNVRSPEKKQLPLKFLLH